jgi:hypothetical protein
MTKSYIHRELGYDLMLMLADSVEHSVLKDVHYDGCYQELNFNNGFSIKFTAWRRGAMPFYLTLFNDKNKYIFELDLSMVIVDEDDFWWNLKVPSNNISKKILDELYGDKKEFDDTYISQIKEQKNKLSSGKNTPKNGYYFVNNDSWEILCEKICRLIKAMTVAHSEEKIRFKIKYQATDDSINSFQEITTRTRRNQRLFRKNLITLYDGQCAISGWTPTEVLEAAHIVGHSKSGVNNANNGILLRADLHRLFDLNLIKINPKTYKVEVSESLEKSKYMKLNGKKILKRIDGEYPGKEYLNIRWSDENK